MEKAFRYFSNFPYLFISGQSVVLVPERNAAVLPADSEGMDHGVPFHLDNCVLASLNLEVGHNGSFFAHENDSGFVCGHGQHQVALVVGPLGALALFVLSDHVVVKEHTHLYKICLVIKFVFLFGKGCLKAILSWGLRKDT